MHILLLAAAATAAPDGGSPASQPAGQADSQSASAEERVVIVQSWHIPPGASLSQVLGGWAERAGWTLVWETNTDFRLAAGGTVEGDFQTAATQLIEAFGQGRPRLRAALYDGNRVLRVWTERGEP